MGQLRAERSQLAEEKRTQCVELLGLAWDFRVLVENTYDSSGPELDAFAQRVRQSAANIARQADMVEFMVPEAETEALSLAAAVGMLAAPVADKKKNGALGSPLLSPNFTQFDRCLAEFKQVARGALSYQQSGMADRADADLVETADLPILESAAGRVQERLG